MSSISHVEMIDGAISKIFLKNYHVGSMYMESRGLEGQMDMACDFRFIMKIINILQYCDL